MSTNCYQTAWEHATNEIAEINAQIQKLARRKELLERLLEPLEFLVPESGSIAIPVTVSDGSNTGPPATEAATQVSPAVSLAEASEPGPGSLEAPAPMTQPEVDETNSHAGRNGASISHKDVAVLTYRFWNERGQAHGHHESDWLRAVYKFQSSA